MTTTVSSRSSLSNCKLADEIVKAQARHEKASDALRALGTNYDTPRTIIARLPVDNPVLVRYEEASLAKHLLEAEAERRLGPGGYPSMLAGRLRALPRTKHFRVRS